jgi:hypothetical protein
MHYEAHLVNYHRQLQDKLHYALFIQASITICPPVQNGTCGCLLKWDPFAVLEQANL